MKTLLNILVIIIISLFGTEMISFGVVWYLSKQPGNEHLAYQVSMFHPLFRGVGEGKQLLPPYRRSDPDNPFRFDPRTSYSNKPHKRYSYDLPIDSNGFICNETCADLPRDKPLGEVRIFLFGGSTMAGVGVHRGADTIPGQLEKLLREGNVFSDRTLHVINAGVGGFFSGQEVNRLINDVLFYHPDMIVFFDGLNDYFSWQFAHLDPYLDRYDGLIRPNLVEYDYQIALGVERIQQPWGAISHTANLVIENFPVLHYAATLAKHMRVMMSGWKNLPPEESGKNYDKDARRKEMIATFHGSNRNNLDTFMSNNRVAAGVGRENKIPTLLCLQPTLGYGKKKAYSETEVKFLGTMLQEKPYISDYYEVARNAFHDLESGNTDLVRRVDMSGLFADTEDGIYVDHGHYNALGNKIIAEAMAKEIAHLRQP